jgi:HEAT repeat protein
MPRSVRWIVGLSVLIVASGLLALRACNSGKSTDQLIADLTSPEEKDRLIAVRLLPQKKRDAAKVVPAMIEALKDRDADVRHSAAIGLGYFGDQAKDAIPALQAAQKDRDARVREAATIAISRISPELGPAHGSSVKSK